MTVLPFTFVPDTVADANQVNSNFQAVANPAGPWGVGINPPANATPGRIFASGGITLQPVATSPSGDLVGHWMVNVYVDTAGTFRYLTNGPAFELACDTTTQTWALRQAPPGTTGAPVPSFERTVSFQPGQITIDALAPSPINTTELVGHLMINALFSPAVNNWIYAADGPAFDLGGDATGQFWAFHMGPSGTAGAVIPWTRIIQMILAPPAGSTNFSLLTNNAGTITLQTVLLGAALTVAADGMPVGARALYVPN